MAAGAPGANGPNVAKTTRPESDIATTHLRQRTLRGRIVGRTTGSSWMDTGLAKTAKRVQVKIEIYVNDLFLWYWKINWFNLEFRALFL